MSDAQPAPNRGTHKQVLVIRKELKMGAGKIGAQCAHASLGAILSLMQRDAGGGRYLAYDERVNGWLDDKFTKPVCYVTSEAELLELQRQAREAGLIECLIVDSGLTHFHGVPTVTALAVGPDLREKVDLVTGHLPLL